MSAASPEVETEASSGRGGPQSVGRVFAILEYLVANPEGATLSELATFAEAPKTSLVGLLDAMVAEGCVRRDASRRYLLGARVFTLAMRALAGRQLTELAHPFLVELVESTGETAVLGVLASDGRHVVYVDKVESPSPIRYAVDLGMQRELHCTALGKVLLAGFDPQQLDRYVAEAPLQRFTPKTITSGSALRAEVARVRKDGIARNVGERIRDASGLAAPIFSGEGRVIAALLIAGPSQRMEARREANERALLKSAAAITDVMGGSSMGFDA
jgi:DNA-binding IclR family transcriptional regulator